MKVCNDYYLLINLYIDGELEGEDARRVEEHLQACPACRRYCDEICMVNRAVQDVSYPKNLHNSIMAAIDAERAAAEDKVIDFSKAADAQPVQKKRRPKGRWIGTVAAMLAVACVGIFGMQGGLAAVFPGVKSAETAADNAAVMEESVTETTDAGSAEQKSTFTMTTKDAAPEALEAPNAQGQQAIRIEELMNGWFTDTTDHVTVLDNGAPMGLDLPDVEAEETPADGKDAEPAPEEGAAEEQILTEAQLEALAALLGEGADGYGFYLVTAGAAEQLPAVFADQAEEAGPGLILVITVRNDDAVRTQILASMAESGFEVYEDDAQTYFVADAAAEEGLVIAMLTE